MTNERAKRVIGVGLACLDQLLIWQDIAIPVEDNRIVATDMQGGGMASTAMVAVTRLGGLAELWTAIGDDWVSDQIVQKLEMEGVNTEEVLRQFGERSLFVVVCIDEKTGERHFKTTGPWAKPSQPIGDIKRIAGAGCLLIDHALPESELRAAKEARRLGIPVVSDTERINDWHSQIFPFVDYAIVSERTARSLNDDLELACQSIQSLGAKHVVVTMGDQGLVYLSDTVYDHLPAFKVKVVDTTGAGDVFHGAFCYGLVQGFSLEHNLRFSSATSAIKCQHLGGRAGIPTRSQVDEFLLEKGFAVE